MGNFRIAENQGLAAVWPALEAGIERLAERPAPELKWNRVGAKETLADRIAALKVGEHVTVYQSVYPQNWINRASRINGSGHWGAKSCGRGVWRVERWG